METRKIKANGKLEFDVIVDGKYQKRVGHGVLLEVDDGNLITYMSANKEDLFGMMLALMQFCAENNLEEEFDKFVEETLK